MRKRQKTREMPQSKCQKTDAVNLANTVEVQTTNDETPALA